MKILQVLLLCASARVGYGHIVEKIIGDAKNTIKGFSGLVTGGLFGLHVHTEEEIEPAPEEPPRPENDGPGLSHHHNPYHHLHHHHHDGRYGRPERPNFHGHEHPVLMFEPSPPPYGYRHPGYQHSQGNQKPGYFPQHEIHNPDQEYHHTENPGPGYGPDRINHQYHHHEYPPDQGSELPEYRPDKPRPGWNQPDVQLPGSHNPGQQVDRGDNQPQYKPGDGIENATYQPDQGDQRPGYQSSQASIKPNGREQPNIPNFEEKPNRSREPDQGNHEYGGIGIPEYAYAPNGASNSSKGKSSQNGGVGTTSGPAREENEGDENFELDIRSSFDDDRKT